MHKNTQFLYRTELHGRNHRRVEQCGTRSNLLTGRTRMTAPNTGEGGGARPWRVVHRHGDRIDGARRQLAGGDMVESESSGTIAINTRGGQCDVRTKTRTQSRDTDVRLETKTRLVAMPRFSWTFWPNDLLQTSEHSPVTATATAVSGSGSVLVVSCSSEVMRCPPACM